MGRSNRQIRTSRKRSQRLHGGHHARAEGRHHSDQCRFSCPTSDTRLRRDSRKPLRDENARRGKKRPKKEGITRKMSKRGPTKVSAAPCGVGPAREGEDDPAAATLTKSFRGMKRGTRSCGAQLAGKGQTSGGNIRADEDEKRIRGNETNMSHNEGRGCGNRCEFEVMGTG